MATGGTVGLGVMSLKSGNYPTWKIQMKMALLKENLWNIVNGSEILPENNEQDAQGKFNRRKDRALATIVLAVDPSLLYLIGEPEDPKTVWEALQGQFQKKTWANKLSLRRKLYGLKLVEGRSVQEHCKEMIELFNELAVVGDPVEEEDRVVHLLASLPDSYDMLVTALEANAEVPKMETVVERLLHEERKHTSKTNVEETGLYTQSASKGPMCYKCRKFGHIKRNCPQSKKPSKSGQQIKGKGEKAHVVEEKNVDLLAEHTALASKAEKTDKWIIDSGATSHMCNSKEKFVELKTIDPIKVTLGDGHALNAVGIGKVLLDIEDGIRSRKCNLHDVLYVPDLAYNLLSVSRAGKAGKACVFDGDGCRIVMPDGETIATGLCEGSLYCLALKNEQSHVAQVSTDTWHRRYGHLGEKNMKRLEAEKMVEGFSLRDELKFCEACAEGKSVRTKFPKSKNRNSDILGLIHSDVCGKITTKSLGGAEYFLTFIDDNTRYVWVYFLKTKDQVFEKFKEWKALVENTFDQKVKTLRTDNGGEYTSNEFEKFLKEQGIRHEKTIPKTPQQNGIAERMNRTLVEATRSLLLDMKKEFWAEALTTAVYLRNRSPTSVLPDRTPYEALTGEKPDVRHLREFGCECYAHIPKDERKKLDPTARKCIFLGYGDSTKAYRLYDDERGRVIHSRDVRFVERNEATVQRIGWDSDLDKSCEDELEKKPTEDPEEQKKPREDSEEPEESEEDPDESADEPQVRRSQREKRPPDRLGEWVVIAADGVSPSTYKEAMEDSSKKSWDSAMKEEMKSLQSNDVWDLVPLPDGRKIVGSKWVYKVKVAADGTVERYKARLVAQGYSQKYGQDYDETFCPVVRGESVRTVIALAAQKGLLLHQMDVVTAFLNGTLDEDVYMKQPEGFVKKGQEDLVCKLKKSLYGLKQSPRCWNTALDKHLKSMGLKQLEADPCLYTAESGETVIIAVYVDDILISTETEKKMNQIKHQLSEKFKIKDLGEMNSFLGVQVNHDAESIWIGQPGYASRILERFGMSECKSVSTPVDVSMKLQKESDSPAFNQKKTYQSAVGSLLYLSSWTRPDITFAVSNVAKYSADPRQEHWVAVKRIFRYIKGTLERGIKYKRNSHDDLIGFCDADWAGDVGDRKSTSGYIFTLSGSPVSWRSKKQTCVALSTAEAEYIALAAAAQEDVWLQSLLQQLSGIKISTVMYDDSQSAIAIAKNPQWHGRTKHIDIKFHYIREQVNNGIVQLKFCPTDKMLADILTKGLSREQHEKLVKGLNVVCN